MRAGGDFVTDDAQLGWECTAYRRAIQKWPAMVEWTAAAKAEPSEAEELTMDGLLEGASTADVEERSGRLREGSDHH